MSECVREGVSIEVAARDLGVTASSIRRWIQRGAPTVAPGSSGRGRGALVDVSALAQWRAARLGVKPTGAEHILEQVTVALQDVIKRDGGHGVPAHVEIGIPQSKAVQLLVHAHERIRRALCPPAETAQE